MTLFSFYFKYIVIFIIFKFRVYILLLYLIISLVSSFAYTIMLQSQVTLSRSGNSVNDRGVEGVLGNGYAQSVL
jgi:hypothetical protein